MAERAGRDEASRGSNGSPVPCIKPSPGRELPGQSAVDAAEHVIKLI